MLLRLSPRIDGVRSKGSWRRLTIVGMSVVSFSRPAVGLLITLKLEVVDPDCPKLGPAEVEDLMPCRGSLAQQQFHLIIAVEVVLVGPVTELHARQQLGSN